jgi:hypothetical protein
MRLQLASPAIFFTIPTLKNALSVKSLDTSQPKIYLPLSIFWTPIDRPDKIHTWVLHYTVCYTVKFRNFKSLILSIFYTTTTSFNPLVASSNLARPTNIKQKPHSQGEAFCLCALH